MAKRRGLKSRPIEQRFWEKVDRKNKESCWNWLGFINPVTGYGQFGRNKAAHKMAYQLSNGEIKSQINHTCDNRSCCNPNHLWDGTQLENMQDAVLKGRHGTTKLTTEQVKYIRKIRPTITLKKLAKEFGVSIGTIHHAEKGISWKLIH
jgi:hypothetical protein